MSIRSERELEEIRRSAIDASRREGSLVARPQLLARYRCPLLNTAFQLEYCYHLLGEIEGKKVLDYGCGAGENSLLLAARGAQVTAIDISPELVEIARRRLEMNQLAGEFRAVSGYNTGLPDGSMDVVFCMAVLHHLDLVQARREVLRVLKVGGALIVQEPVRDSRTYAFLRKLIPYSAHDNSEYERPLKRQELDAFADGFLCEAKRRFKLPFVSLVQLASRRLVDPAFRVDSWMLKAMPALAHLATIEVRKLRRL